MPYLSSTPNPFNLVGPPAWFLAQMAALDSALTIFPSQEQGVYRVARKVPHGHIARFSMQFIQKRPDTKTYIDHGLAPVTSLLPFVQWGPVVLSDLAEMDMKRFGGADKVADELERREAETERKSVLDTADRADTIAADYFRTHRYVSGQTVFQNDRKGAREGRTTTFQPLNFKPGGSTVILAGR